MSEAFPLFFRCRLVARNSVRAGEFWIHHSLESIATEMTSILNPDSRFASAISDEIEG